LYKAVSSLGAFWALAKAGIVSFRGIVSVSSLLSALAPGALQLLKKTKNKKDSGARRFFIQDLFFKGHVLINPAKKTKTN
jgi:hypothetical protein